MTEIEKEIRFSQDPCYRCKELWYVDCKYCEYERDNKKEEDKDD